MLFDYQERDQLAICDFVCAVGPYSKSQKFSGRLLIGQNDSIDVLL